MSHFLVRLNYFSNPKESFSDGFGVTNGEDRTWEDAYRNRWAHDKIVRSTHGVNCTGSCSWKIYVKGGIVTWETQQTDYPRTRPDMLNHEPRGCTTGIGNGLTFRMIPVIFLTERARAAEGKGPDAQEQALKNANKEAAAVLGFSAAIAAYGGFFIPKSYGTSIDLTGGPEGALYVFIFYYLTCIAMTWWYNARRNAEMPC